MLTNSENEKELCFLYNQESSDFKYYWVSGGKKTHETKMGKIQQKIITIEHRPEKADRVPVRNFRSCHIDMESCPQNLLTKAELSNWISWWILKMEI